MSWSRVSQDGVGHSDAELIESGHWRFISALHSIRGLSQRLVNLWHILYNIEIKQNIGWGISDKIILIKRNWFWINSDFKSKITQWKIQISNAYTISDVLFSYNWSNRFSAVFIIVLYSIKFDTFFIVYYVYILILFLLHFDGSLLLNSIAKLGQFLADIWGCIWEGNT